MQVKIVLVYVIIINIITFLYYAIDKQHAIVRKKRIPEHMLLILAVIGGSAGAWASMLLFHHKTKHWKFILVVPAMFIIQFIILAIFIGNESF